MDLRLRIKEYLRFLWKEEKTQFDDEEAKILKNLPIHLKEEFFLASYGQILLNNPIFLTNFSKKCLTEVIYQGCLKKIRLTPGDCIFSVFY